MTDISPRVVVGANAPPETHKLGTDVSNKLGQIVAQLKALQDTVNGQATTLADHESRLTTGGL